MLITVTAATAEPVTLTEAKAHLRVIHDSDDALIASQITAARQVVELNTGRALADADYLWAVEPGLCGPLRLPLVPAGQVTAVTYLDGDRARQALATDGYYVDLDRGSVELLTGDGSRAPNVEFSTAVTDVPAALKAAILLMVGDLYENSEASSEKTLVENPAVQRLIFPYRINLGV